MFSQERDVFVTFSWKPELQMHLKSSIILPVGVSLSVHLPFGEHWLLGSSQFLMFLHVGGEVKFEDS
jgi:hypothetical protein